jgi:hypothetical protein
MNKSISSKTKKKTEKASVDKRPETNPVEIDGAAKNPFDFGGLPLRDLKKNLGCG